MGRDLHQYCPAYQDHTLQWGRVENVLACVGEIEGRIWLEEDNCQSAFAVRIGNETDLCFSKTCLQLLGQKSVERY